MLNIRIEWDVIHGCCEWQATIELSNSTINLIVVCTSVTDMIIV